MKRLVLALTATLAAGSAVASAQAAPAAAPAAALTGVRADMLAQLDDAASKIEQLAGAIGQDKYGWRPAQGVRSVSEVLMHVVGGNYYVLTFAGVQPSTQLARDAEKSVTDKAQVAAALKQSFDHVRTAIRGAKDADLDKPTTMFGRQTTMRNVYLTTVSHAHEHLGQLIAYARSNGVVPPWSM
jgi:uncharacterized damage-inducible protein DinB